MFTFPEACGDGANSYRGGWGILKSRANRYREGGVSEFSVIFPNDGADMFNRESVRENSWVVCRKGCCFSVVQWLLLKKGDGCSLQPPWGS
jgi:hypothetical protein